MPLKNNKNGVAKIKRILPLAIAIALLAVMACSSDDGITPSPTPSAREVVRKVAVVAPIGETATKTRLERTAAWLAENLKEAQQGDSVIVSLQVEWYDEQGKDMETLGNQLAGRSDILSIVGPFSNELMDVFASTCKKTHKPLIAPTITSEDVIRKYSVSNAGVFDKVNKEAFFWPLCETDVKLAETMLEHFVTQIGRYSGNVILNAAFFSPRNVFGKTFYDWAPFHANNMNVNLVSNMVYANASELQSHFADYLNQWGNKDYTGPPSISSLSKSFLDNSFCIVENTQQMADVAQERRKRIEESLRPYVTDTDDIDFDGLWSLYEGTSRTWFVYPSISDEALSALGEGNAQILQGYQGFMPYADLSTGFEEAYRQRFGTPPTFAECKLYDGLLLSAMTAHLYEYLVGADRQTVFADFSDNELMNYMMAIVGLKADDASVGAPQPAWRGDALRRFIGEVRAPETDVPVLCGASGVILFDAETSRQIGNNTYLLWQIDQGKLRHLTYFTSKGKQVVNPSISWDMFYDEETVKKSFAEMATDKDLGIVYPGLTSQYAVLVQGSSGMSNYRHQADVLGMYQLLRKNGFDDDHIILIVDKALANNPQNTDPGVIRNEEGGEDLLKGAEIDYDNNSLSASDVADILTGKSSAKLPVVMPQDAGQNVLFYWSGHGRNTTHYGVDELVWLDTPEQMGFTASMMQQAMEQMTRRKLLVVVEPCYSEGVILSLQGQKGVLAMSSASGDERSWADNWNPNLGGGTWMCDRFSRNLLYCLTKNPAITYRGLYFYCMENTIGSHVKLVNAENFGNLYVSTPEEFVVYKHNN